MQNLMRINTDRWEDVGKIYNVLSYKRTPNSTAIHLQLEYEGVLYNRVVAENQIEWIQD